MRVLAIDPGKTTGFAEWRDREFSAWAIAYDVALDFAMGQIMGSAVDHVVMEDFLISQRTVKLGTANWKPGKELEFIGAVRWACDQRDISFTTQTPSQTKSFATDAKLKHIGWWTKGLDHPRDATRHLMLWLVENKLLDPRSLVGGQ